MPQKQTPGPRQLLRVVLIIAAFSTNSVRAQDASFQKATFVYKTVGDVRIEADVYRAADKKPRPVVVWLHGGGLINGSRASVPQRMRELCGKEGYALVSLDYRLMPEVKLRDAAQDIDDAFSWLHRQGKSLLHVDSHRCVIAGESAGGYLTLMAGTRLKSRPLGLISYWGFADLVEVDTPKYVESMRQRFPLVSKADAYKAVGGRVLTSAEGSLASARNPYFSYVLQNGLWFKEVAGFAATDLRLRDLYSPIRSVKPDYPPTLLIHGTADRLVFSQESEAMAEQLVKLKVPHELITVAGGDHGLYSGDKQQIEDAHARAAAFIRERLSAPGKTKSKQGKRSVTGTP